MEKRKVFSLIFRILGLTVLTVLLGYLTFIGAIILAFMGNLYLSYGIMALGGGIIIYLWFITFWKSKRKVINIIGISYFGIIVLATGGFLINKAIEDSIPIVGDGSLLLSEYIPFGENTKLVSLKEESELKFTDNLPKVDGATALFPVYSAFVQAVYPEFDYSVYERSPSFLDFTDEDIKGIDIKEMGLKETTHLKCTKTNTAYIRLINREADIIFAAGPSEEQLKMTRDAGVTMKLTPIGREAFVFFVNSKNNIKGLTVEEVQKIYSGEVKNWSEFGGNNDEIVAFQRPQNSGSQTALQRLMKGKKLLAPIKADVVDGMGGIIAKTASYKNYKNAIGYSFRFFSTEMVKNNQIKLLSLNDVFPTKDTIRDGSYPISNNFYAITLTDNEDVNVKRFIDWILGEQGQYIIEETGYVGI